MMPKETKINTDDEQIEVAAAAEPGADVIVDTIDVANKSADDTEMDWKAQFEGAQKKIEESEAARKAAEQLAQSRADDLDRAQRETAKTRSDAVSAEMLAINNAIANTEHERADAEQAYVQAMETGDFKAAAAAQSKMADTAVKAQRIKEGKAELERRAEAAKNQPDVVEQAVANMSPRSAAWVRSHPDVIRDPSKRRALEMAHYRALGNGIAAESDEYYQHMDVEMGYAARPAAQDAVEDDPAPARAPVAPAAPVSRGGAAQAPVARPNVVRLTKEQRDVAEMCGMTDAEYARELVRLRAEGQMTH